MRRVRLVRRGGGIVIAGDLPPVGRSWPCTARCRAATARSSPSTAARCSGRPTSRRCAWASSRHRPAHGASFCKARISSTFPPTARPTVCCSLKAPQVLRARLTGVSRTPRRPRNQSPRARAHPVVRKDVCGRFEDAAPVCHIGAPTPAPPRALAIDGVRYDDVRSISEGFAAGAGAAGACAL